MISWVWWCVLVLSCIASYNTVWSNETKADRRDVAVPSKSILLISTLNGALHGIDKHTGKLLWTLQEDPVLSQPLEDSPMGLRLFPNPKDGSLYAFNSNGDQLERLPLTIPELVRISPAKGSDGLLYTARKYDVWLVIDPETGTKLRSFSNNGVTSHSCPVFDAEERAVYIARSAYTVTVFDGQGRQVRWNTTYWDYASFSYNEPVSQDLLHFCSSSDGTMLSVDALTGHEVWREDYQSPVVSIYSLEGSGLRKLQSVSVASDTLNSLTGSSVLAIHADTSSIKASDSAFQSSLFIGTHDGHLYAVESLTEEGNIRMEFSMLQSSMVPLIEGPQEKLPTHDHEEDNVVTATSVSEVGHFCLPYQADTQLTPLQKQIQEVFGKFPTSSSQIFGNKDEVCEELTISDSEESPQHDDVLQTQVSRFSDIGLPLITILVSSLMAAVVAFIVTHTNKSKKELVIISSDQEGLSSSWSVSDTKGSLHTSASSSLAETGEVRIGKISYFPDEILGHGSQGTVVFKGSFDKRLVAVKRILPECFDLAEKEVDLLRQSDQHPNVIRYFCMEKDAVFCYIALQLCQATLRDFVENQKSSISESDQKKLLHEAMKGLAYLHSIGIVHRDIKPRNVLLSHSSAGIRAVISDFGLCRKMSVGRGSLTARSGVAGTEGWIAPEMLSNNSRVTFAVDIFSMGCVIYYVLTQGSHPFGTPLVRQGNIEAGDSSLANLTGKSKYAALDLVKAMISNNYLFRPSANEVLCHCLFWTKERQLAFFQDVSDRIEKEPTNSSLMKAVEQGSHHVVKGDWRNHITEELREDLRRFRTYQGSSVRDLLRAMRNKKHHYRELNEELKLSLGSLPDEFVDYFTSRFPLLLVHTYNCMDMCKKEKLFSKYYVYKE